MENTKENMANIPQSTTEETLGSILRNARLKKDKPISDLAAILCILKYYIEALENDEYKKLPHPPYGSGFVRSISEYLELNSARMVQMYKESSGLEKNMVVKSVGNSDAVKTNNGPNMKHIWTGLAVLIILIIGWNLQSLLHKGETGVEESLVSEVVPEPVIIEENEDSEISDSEMDMENALNNTENNIVEEQTENTNAEEDTANSKDSLLKGEQKNLQNEKQTEDAPAIENSNVEKNIANENQVSRAEDQKPQIKIVFVGPSWIELKQGDKIVLQGEYRKGFEYEIKDAKDMSISVGRYRNVNFYVNGKLTKIASAMKQTNINLEKYVTKENQE